MANIDAPFGLIPATTVRPNMIQKCYVSSGYGTALFRGDAVDINPTLAQKDSTGFYQSIEQASAGNGEYIYGVILAFDINYDDLTKTYIPASTGGYAYVCVDPDMTYLIRDDGAATPGAVMVGQNANLIQTHSGNTTTGISGMELDMNSDAPAADASNQLMIRRLLNRPDNSLGAHGVWEVSVNLARAFKATGDGDGSLGVTAS